MKCMDKKTILEVGSGFFGKYGVLLLLLLMLLGCAGPPERVPPDLNSCRQWAEISCQQELQSKSEFERCYREQLSRCMNPNIYKKDKAPD